MHIRIGLYDSNESLVINVLNRFSTEKITIKELFSLLLSHEIKLKMSKGKTYLEVMHDVSANFAQK